MLFGNPSHVRDTVNYDSVAEAETDNIRSPPLSALKPSKGSVVFPETLLEHHHFHESLGNNVLLIDNYTVRETSCSYSHLSLTSVNFFRLRLFLWLSYHSDFKLWNSDNNIQLLPCKVCITFVETRKSCCKRRTARDITCPSAIHCWGKGEPPSSPNAGGGVPPSNLGWSTPLSGRMGYPPSGKIGVCPPLGGKGVPPSETGDWLGYPPEDRQTFRSINITFPRTSYATDKWEIKQRDCQS